MLSPSLFLSRAQNLLLFVYFQMLNKKQASMVQMARWLLITHRYVVVILFWGFRYSQNKNFWILSSKECIHNALWHYSRSEALAKDGSLCTTKSERILSKIPIPTNLRASSAPCGRGSKTQNFSLSSSFSAAGGVGGADKKWKGNFWFCFAVFINNTLCILVL